MLDISEYPQVHGDFMIVNLHFHTHFEKIMILTNKQSLTQEHNFSFTLNFLIGKILENHNENKILTSVKLFIHNLLNCAWLKFSFRFCFICNKNLFIYF